MSNVVDILIEMGFSRQKAELAVLRSGTPDVQSAMDWLLSHEEELDRSESQTPLVQSQTLFQPQPQSQPQLQSQPQPQLQLQPQPQSQPQLQLQPLSQPETEPLEEVKDLSNEAAPTTSEEIPSADTGSEETSSVARSIQCDECGKLFKTQEEVEFHASKSGHENFSESYEEKTPLSEEEKKEQLAKITSKLRQRRLEREAREQEEAQQREKMRIKSGKELLEAKKKHDELEMKRIVEQRKREKEEERLAKQRVREQIEQDKLARKQKFGGAGLLPETITQPVPPAQSSPAKSSGSYTDVKLQIRLPNGTTLSQTFGAKEPLSAVRLFIDMNRGDGEGAFNIMTNFPKKVFRNEDYDKPLESLGLVPTATLIVFKA